MASDHSQNYYGASGLQNQQQRQYASFQTQRPHSTANTTQYSSHNQPTSQSYTSYSAQAYAPSGTTYNLSDYSYGSANYGTNPTAGGVARNSGSADLQNLAYASGLHESVQRASAQSAVANRQAMSSTQAQQAAGAYDGSRQNYSTSFAAYGQQQSRPKSVNSLVGGNNQRSPAVDTRQLNRSGLHRSNAAQQSPSMQSTSAQQRAKTSPQVTNAYQAPASHPAQPSDYTNRALPNVTPSTLAVTTTAPYQWASQNHSHADTSGSRDFETVDPMQVYDPWPEIQRKREAARAAKALEERAQAERERLEREKVEREQAERERVEREAEEAKKAEEVRKAEELKKAEEQRQAEEQRRREEERRKQAQQAQEQQNAALSGKQKKANTKSKMSKAAAAAASSSASAQAAPSVDVEVQMRALMAQMRELNGKNPELLAKIWEEERRSHFNQQPNQRAAPSTNPPVQITSTQATHAPLATAQQTKPQQIPPQPQVHQPQQQQPPPQQAPQQHQQLAQPQQRPEQPQRQAVRPKAPLKPPSGGIPWPPDKKDAISKAAAEWLNNLPENRGKQISPQEICSFLNHNPKYIELCEWLGSQGMTLERGAFARALLAKVPDINQPSGSPAPNQVNGATQHHPTPNTSISSGPAGQANTQAHHQPQSVTVGQHLQQQQPQYGPPDQPQYRSPYFVPGLSNAPATAQLAIPTPPPRIPVAPMGHTKHDRQNSGSRQGSAQREDSQKPASKADAARKRNFSEIVDLTLLSDDEEPPVKKSQVDVNSDIAPTWAAPPDSVFQQYQANTGSFQAQLPAVVQVDDRTKNMDVVQPLNRKHALRRSTYEIKTIARDVLLATGKHPEMRPLNGHLEMLKESFKKVDNASDLSTLRWDLIDPGDPPPEALKPTGAELEDEDADDEEDVPKDEPRPPQPKLTPTSAPSPSFPPPAAKVSSSPAIASAAAKASSSLSTASTPKKRGRPKGSDISSGLQGPKHAAGAGNARATPATRDRDDRASTTSTVGTPSKRQTLTMATGYAAFREQQYGLDGKPLPKKKGRPVGWRKAIHGKDAQAGASGSTPASTPRPSGLRQSQTSNGMVVIASPSPSVSSTRRAPASYSVFKCEWEGCAAELHNLETLKKHLFKFHQSKNSHKKYPCFWEGCAENERTIDQRTGKPNGFSTDEDWRDHVEFAHLGPKSWKLGDGHAGGLSESHDSTSEAYLSDTRTGRQVTPRISAPSKEQVEAAAAAAAPVRRGPGRPKLKTDEQKARDAQTALEQKKRMVGPGIDRGGARLANEKRRLGLIDDEDFEEIVSDSD